MFPEQLKKILNLVKKTGDRVIVFDGNAPDDSYVIMNFDNYSELAATGNSGNFSPVSAKSEVKSDQTENLTEEDLTDKINREISMWKNRDDLSSATEENKPKQAWQIPPQVKDKAREIQE
ncbi:TPA: hypothetical protein DCZ15_03795 [Candidatus Falkowbacteria bacterium]|jgi:hypothetical protein|nr:MAG: hypothetical protein UV95_C0001G0046 [Candidatus Falkowbacteria bacterium GW2011_GWF2_43_32]HBA36966.1 hypothetical protein [Candidatus Falkowbacteria bacterium]